MLRLECDKKTRKAVDSGDDNGDTAKEVETSSLGFTWCLEIRLGALSSPLRRPVCGKGLNMCCQMMRRFSSPSFLEP